MLFVIKGYLPMKIVESIKGLFLEHIGYDKNRANKNVQYSHKD